MIFDAKCIITSDFLLQEFKGDANTMFEHLKSEAHVWAYFHRIYGKDFIQEDYDYDGKPELAKSEFNLALNNNDSAFWALYNEIKNTSSF